MRTGDASGRAVITASSSTLGATVMGSMPAERRMCSREGEVEAKMIRGLLIVSDFSEGGIVKPNFCDKHAWLVGHYRNRGDSLLARW